MPRGEKAMRLFRIFNLRTKESWEGEAADMREALVVAGWKLDCCRVTEFKTRVKTEKEWEKQSGVGGGGSKVTGGWCKPEELK